jgi:hypothetical protein
MRQGFRSWSPQLIQVDGHRTVIGRKLKGRAFGIPINLLCLDHQQELLLSGSWIDGASGKDFGPCQGGPFHKSPAGDGRLEGNLPIGHLPDPLPAGGAKIEIRLKRPSAGPAGRPWPGRAGSGGYRCGLIVNRPLTPLAIKKGGSLFDPQQRDEKQAEIVVHTPQLRLEQAARRTPRGGLIQHPGFRLNPGD